MFDKKHLETPVCTYTYVENMHDTFNSQMVEIPDSLSTRFVHYLPNSLLMHRLFYSLPNCPAKSVLRGGTKTRQRCIYFLPSWLSTLGPKQRERTTTQSMSSFTMQSDEELSDRRWSLINACAFFDIILSPHQHLDPFNELPLGNEVRRGTGKVASLIHLLIGGWKISNV